MVSTMQIILNYARAGTDTHTHKVDLKKIMEDMNAQHKKEMESIRQNQPNMQNKNSTESISNRLSQWKESISDLEDRLAVSNHKKGFLKIAGDNEKLIAAAIRGQEE